MSKPHTHYFEVSIFITDYKKEYLDIQMPVWAPGSYLIREFSKNVEKFQVFSNQKEIKTTQLNKNTWRIYSNNATDIKVSYLVYANELSVRNSFVDASHGYFNGTSMFMYIDELKNQPTTLKIIPYKDWKKVSTSLKKTSTTEFKYEAPNYDILVDSPVEIGNHETFSFNAAGLTHYVAMYGQGNYNVEKLKTDMAKVIEAATDVFGENPNKEYTFIIHNLTKGGGGLEHLSSTTLQVNRWTYEGEDYKGFLSLVAHEYFHLWNVKRIRPDVLGPFDYNNENYTDLLWVMEGFTSYYDELLLYRAGIYTEDEIIRKLAGSINSIENQPGNKVQSAAESSFNAWIKGYRPNENSYNTSISYYTKGAVIANMLDLMIAESTQGEKSLDDAMKFLYQEYYKKQARGFNITEMRKALEQISGLDLTPFFDKYVFGTETFDYKTIFNYANYEMLILDNKKISLGISFSNNYIKSITRNTSAYDSGLNVGDEIIAVNGLRFEGSFSDFINYKKIGDKISVLISRDNIIQTIEFPLIESKSTSYNLTKKDDSENIVYKKWLRKL
ncbi:MAG: M61 family metallopeptidase [Bacteroidetes bacterium]|nr:M61 family metallopeptidase [Bacteroidota bacterium]